MKLFTKKKLLIPVIIISAILGFIFLGGEKNSDLNTYHKVTRSNMTISITEGGTLEAVKEVTVKNSIEKESRIIYLIPEGSYVKEGDLLVEFDSSETESAVQETQVKLESRQADLIRAENDLIITKSTVKSDIRAAELDVKFASMDLQKFEELEETHELRESSLDIDTQEESLKLAQQKYKWSEKLAEKGFETTTQVDRDKLDVSRSEKALETAKSKHKMLMKFDLQKKYEQYFSEKKEAEAKLIRVKKEGESKITKETADVNSAKSTLRVTKEQLEKKQEQLAATKLYAPQEGLALHAKPRNRWSNQTKIEEGAEIRNRRAVIKIPDISSMKVEVKVHESMVGQVKEGQKSWIVLDALPDKRFRGEVSKVSILPDSGQSWVNPDLKVYSTEITISDDTGDIKPGISAKAEIIVEKLSNVIQVPIQSVTTLDGQQVCYLKGKKEPVPVVIGLFNTDFIEIKSGLNEGDQVLLNPPFIKEDKSEEDPVSEVEVANH